MTEKIPLEPDQALYYNAQRKSRSWNHPRVSTEQRPLSSTKSPLWQPLAGSTCHIRRLKRGLYARWFVDAGEIYRGDVLETFRCYEWCEKTREPAENPDFAVLFTAFSKAELDRFAAQVDRNEPNGALVLALLKTAQHSDPSAFVAAAMDEKLPFRLSIPFQNLLGQIADNRQHASGFSVDEALLDLHLPKGEKIAKIVCRNQ